MRHLLLLLFILFCWSQLQAQGLNNLKFTTYTTQHGLANNLTWATTIDRKGYLWVSHFSGVSRFDGVTFKNYAFNESSPGGLRSAIEVEFELDNSGRLWLSSSAGICWYDEQHDRFNYITPQDTTLDFVPRSMLFDGKETIWITGGSTLFRLNTRTLDITPIKERIEYTFDIANDRSGNIWVTVFLSGLYRYTPSTGALKFYPRRSNINGLFPDAQGRIWFSEGSQLVVLYPDSGKMEEFPAGKFFEKGMSYIGGPQMNTFPRLTGEDVLWIPSIGNGIVLFDMAKKKYSGQIKHDPYRPNGLPAVDLHSAIRFDDHVMWLTSDQGGLIKLDLNDQQFQPVRFPFLSAENLEQVFKIQPDRTDASIWWVAVQGGGLVRYDTKTKQVLKWLFKTGEERFIEDIVYDNRGRLWVAGRKGAAVSNDGISFKSINLNIKDRLPYITRIAPLDGDELWLMAVGGVILYNTQTGRSRFTAIGKDIAIARSGQALAHILPDAQGNLFTSGFFGIHRVDYASGIAEKLTESNFGHEGGVSGSYEMAFDRKGKLWFGTRGSLACFDPSTGKTEFFDDHNGFIQTACYHVFFDDSEYLWLLTTHGLCRMDTETRKFKWYTAPGGASAARNYTGAVKGRSKIGNDFYITLLSANFQFNPLLADKNEAQATPLISLFKIRNQPVPFSADEVAKEPLRLSYYQNFLSFDFTAINYTQPERMQFRYQLEGSGEGWTEPSQNRNANFTNLAPGSYTFKVMTANSAGIWNEQPAVFRFNILPPWWATWWFRLLVSGVLIFSGIAYFQSRVRKIREKAEVREREAGYKQREAELQREVAEFSKQVAEVELAALRAQMNPHFVFNCLNSINTFILLNDPKNASGYLQKFSRKGWVCKTQEGELAMTTVPGVAPVLWNFSVWDEAVAKKLDGQMGKRVVLHYKEYRYIPTTCFGETTYFVDRVEL
ncbi:MAG: histidine kinase, partial [Saprospiraceae bacterium]|nr:histidine kinase [Saprospiraceae bacterium]